jgi:hypothetical protein
MAGRTLFLLSLAALFAGNVLAAAQPAVLPQGPPAPLPDAPNAISGTNTSAVPAEEQQNDPALLINCTLQGRRAGLGALELIAKIGIGRYTIVTYFARRCYAFLNSSGKGIAQTKNADRGKAFSEVK